MPDRSEWTSLWVMLKIMKQAKNRPLRVIYLLLLCSTHRWAFSLEKWCGDLEIDTKHYYVSSIFTIL